jgi:glycerol-3-phosphate acyltransferase PlsY
MITPLVLALVVGYLFGSLPFGYLVARAKGVNIFEVGSKNPGATNVRRVLGSGPGNLVLVLDALKGTVAVGFSGILARLGVGLFTRPEHEMVALEIAGLAASLLGHSFSIFTHFKGGKGVATGAGGFAVLFPLGAAIAIGVFAVVLALSRYVSLASMLAACSLPFAAFAFKQPSPVISLSAMVAAFVIYRHRANLARLRLGTETKIGQAKANAAKP